MSELLLDAPPRELHRTFDLADLSLRTNGDGRTVEAYAAAFDQETEVTDIEGHYTEVIRQGAFGRSITQHNQGELPIRVFFNHGRTFFGREAERFAMPLGTPVEIKEDGKGLWTVTRFARSDLADEVLELISDGAVTHQSVTFGRPPGGGGTKVHSRSGLPLVERVDVRLYEYGPALNKAAYPGAQIVGVRTLADQIHTLSPDEKQELIEALQEARSDHPTVDPARTSPEPARTSTVGPADELLIRTHELKRAHRQEGVSTHV